ncbi:unnamed protein product [Fraxinus pennsylvanica]|uniref:HVA22-like protein n=1 Tax=Fraxinus pennsylvanica TaxID=56036 RepID=A0AAD1YRE8_9LAMI|nr:unnamed protein product [Fraxinus pennsylvanica]
MADDCLFHGPQAPKHGRLPDSSGLRLSLPPLHAISSEMVFPSAYSTSSSLSLERFESGNFDQLDNFIFDLLTLFLRRAQLTGCNMIGSFITWGLVMVFGYAYPAYECYKTVEMNKPDIEQLRFWCQYWILVAILTVCERIGDLFISWVPMYGEAKLAFFLYLWLPKTKGTIYVYDSFFRPYVAKHETDIDRNLLELRTRAGDMAVLYWRKIASYGQTRIFDILQYIASQSTPPRRAQQQQQGPGVRRSSAPTNQRSTAKTQPQSEQPPSPTSSTSSSQHQENVAEEDGPSESLKAALPTSVLNAQKITPAQAQAYVHVESTQTLSATEEQVMPTDSVPPSANETAQPPPQDVVMEEAVRVTRARSRRAARGGSNC